MMNPDSLHDLESDLSFISGGSLVFDSLWSQDQIATLTAALMAEETAHTVEIKKEPAQRPPPSSMSILHLEDPVPVSPSRHAYEQLVSGCDLTPDQRFRHIGACIQAELKRGTLEQSLVQSLLTIAKKIILSRHPLPLRNQELLQWLANLSPQGYLGLVNQAVAERTAQPSAPVIDTRARAPYSVAPGNVADTKQPSIPDLMPLGRKEALIPEIIIDSRTYLPSDMLPLDEVDVVLPLPDASKEFEDVFHVSDHEDLPLSFQPLEKPKPKSQLKASQSDSRTGSVGSLVLQTDQLHFSSRSTSIKRLSSEAHVEGWSYGS
jgi:hypothetical protein